MDGSGRRGAGGGGSRMPIDKKDSKCKLLKTCNLTYILGSSLFFRFFILLHIISFYRENEYNLS